MHYSQELEFRTIFKQCLKMRYNPYVNKGFVYISVFPYGDLCKKKLQTALWGLDSVNIAGTLNLQCKLCGNFRYKV